MSRTIDYMPTLRELVLAEKYQDEIMCVQMIEAKTVGPLMGTQCPTCQKGTLRIYDKNSRRDSVRATLLCSRWNDCKYIRTGFGGTIFKGTQIPLLTWFQVISLVYKTNGKLSVGLVVNRFNVSYETADRMLRSVGRQLGIEIAKKRSNKRRKSL